MVKQIMPALVVVVVLSSCSSLKPLNFTSSKQVISAPAVMPANARFIDDITVSAAPVADKTSIIRSDPGFAASVVKGPNPSLNIAVKAEKEEAGDMSRLLASRTSGVESASAVELKYSVLLDMEVELLPEKPLLENVDEWYGVRYRSGGNSKKGVDCSGFVCAVYTALYGITLPRVSREQYRISRKISTTELQQGDLLFFNTTGRGVSHVGIYLGNNRFIHASVSKGVMVNSMFETYYLKRFVGAGRIDDKQIAEPAN